MRGNAHGLGNYCLLRCSISSQVIDDTDLRRINCHFAIGPRARTTSYLANSFDFKPYNFLKDHYGFLSRSLGDFNANFHPSSFCLGDIHKPRGLFLGHFEPLFPLRTILQNKAYLPIWTFVKPPPPAIYTWFMNDLLGARVCSTKLPIEKGLNIWTTQHTMMWQQATDHCLIKLKAAKIHPKSPTLN